MELHQLMEFGEVITGGEVVTDAITATPMTEAELNSVPLRRAPGFDQAKLNADIDARLAEVTDAAPETVRRKIDAVLHDVRFLDPALYGSALAFGRIEADTSGRFKDGDVITTSTVQGRWNNIIWTRNSCYFVASELDKSGNRVVRT